MPYDSSCAIELMKELMRDTHNLYGLENWDFDRFGIPASSPRSRVVSWIKAFLREHRIAVVPWDLEREIDRTEILRDRLEGLSWLYELLEDEVSRSALVKTVAFRVLGHTRVKLPVNTSEYWRMRESLRRLIKNQETVQLEFRDWALNYFELHEIGFPIQLFTRIGAVLKIFVLGQYEYRKTTPVVKARPGDFVIDAGGCWGDTALYFAHQVGEKGSVWTFEFVPNNLEILQRNLDLNPASNQTVSVVPHPLWSESNTVLLSHDRGPGSRLNDQRTGEHDIQVSTLSIDDFVHEYGVPKVDLIKMDIEGAELPALQGAMETLGRHKPKLAISVYHSWDDFVDIPRFLASLGLGYRFHLDHFSIHAEETILFAEAR